MGSGGPPDDAVVHHHDSLPLDYFHQGVEFLTDPYVAQSLFGLDESAANVAVLNQSFAIWDTRLPGVSDGRRDG